MKKKFLSVFIATLMVFGLCGCSSSDKENVTKSANAFLTACEKGDFDTASKYTTSDVAKQLQINDLDSQLNTRFASFTAQSGEKTKAALNTFIGKVKEAMIKDPKLNDDYDDDKKTVTASVQYLDTHSASNLTLQTKATALSKSYATIHKTELQDIYKSQGMTALKKAIIEGIAEDLFKAAETDYLDKMTYKNETWSMTFEEVGDTWKITRISRA